MDNLSDQGDTPNRSSHVHHYVLKGSGLSCWAECRGHDFQPIPEMPILKRCSRCGWGWKWEENNDFPCPASCGHKLAGDNGPIVGSRAKILAAMP